MIPAPTTSRTASARKPPDLGWEPDSRREEEHDHVYLRTLAGIGCGLAALPVTLSVFVLLVGAAWYTSREVVVILVLVLLVSIAPIAFAWRWRNPGHYAVAYLMIWVPFTAVFLLVWDAYPWIPLIAEYGLFSLGLPLCVVAWSDWMQVLWTRRVLRFRTGAYAGDWRVVLVGVGMYLAGVVLAFVACGAVFLLPVGVVLATVGFLIPGPRPARPPAPVYAFPVATGPPPACPRCAAPLVWAPSVGRWSCPRCLTYV